MPFGKKAVIVEYFGVATADIFKLIHGCGSYQLAEDITMQLLYELWNTNYSQGGYSNITVKFSLRPNSMKVHVTASSDSILVMPLLPKQENIYLPCKARPEFQHHSRPMQTTCMLA